MTSSIATKWTQDNTKISNWDTAYSWGDHSVAGYADSDSVQAQFNAIPTTLVVAKRTGPVNISITNATFTVVARTGNISIGVS